MTEYAPAASAPQARRLAYDLLARLYLHEPDRALVAELRGLPGFDALLPPEAGLDAWLAEEAAEFQWLFGLNIYPYESVFRDPELMLNTATTEAVAALYQACGFDPGPAGAGAVDHLGLELRLMGALAAAEARAAETGDTGKLRGARQMQARMLAAHLGAWAPVYALTLRRVARRPLHDLLATLTLELVLGDLALFPARPVAPRGDPGGGPGAINRAATERAGAAGAAPGAINRAATDPGDAGAAGGEEAAGAALADDMSINAVVRRLITPAEVGVFLARADIAALGRALDLPVTIGDRFAMLRGLFAAAGQFDLLPGLLTALTALFAGAAAEIAGLADVYPAWAGPAAGWQARVAAGRALLHHLQGTLRTLVL